MPCLNELTWANCPEPSLEPPEPRGSFELDETIEDDMPICPICGAPTNFVYQDRGRAIIGCVWCITERSAWDLKDRGLM